MSQYHIQGSDNGSIRLGLYKFEKLVAVMTFGKLRRCLGSNIKSDVYEIYRYCTNFSVPGGASKLLEYFKRIYNPVKIISYADRRWSVGKLYTTLKFKLLTKTKPNYWYTKDYIKRYHRYNFAKHTLSKKLDNFDSNLSEWENMKNNGYDRIWDCGHLKYELICN